jgi:hypothetical protein
VGKEVSNSHSKLHLPLPGISDSQGFLPSGVTQILNYEMSEFLITILLLQAGVATIANSLISVSMKILRDVPLCL